MHNYQQHIMSSSSVEVLEINLFSEKSIPSNQVYHKNMFV